MDSHRVGTSIIQACLAIIFLAFGYAKFFQFEAAAVEPLIASHPALSWLLAVFGQTGASRFLGVVEIATGCLIFIGFLSAWASVAGGALALATFAVTVTLIVFVPGVFEASAGGFPALSGVGQFLIKDAGLLAAALAVLLDAWPRAFGPAGRSIDST
jgi:reactive chlorine resistance protein C